MRPGERRFDTRERRFDTRERRFDTRGAKVRHPGSEGSTPGERRFDTRGAKVRHPGARGRTPGNVGRDPGRHRVEVSPCGLRSPVRLRMRGHFMHLDAPDSGLCGPGDPVSMVGRRACEVASSKSHGPGSQLCARGIQPRLRGRARRQTDLRRRCRPKLRKRAPREAGAGLLSSSPPFLPVLGDPARAKLGAQRPVHVGRRFSAKAFGPSCASSLRYTCSDTCLAARRAAERPISVESMTISRAA
jgi:hypothetical protein